MAKRRSKSTKKRTTKRRASTSARRGTQVVVVRANPSRTSNPPRKRRRTRRSAARVSNPAPARRRRRGVSRRSNPGPVGTGLAVAGVAVATGLAVAMVLPSALQHASPRVVGAGLMAVGIGGAMMAKKSPIVGYPVAALGGGIGATMVAQSFGLTVNPGGGQPTMGQIAMGAVEQAVGAIGHGSGSEVYRTPVASSHALGIV